MQACVDNAKVAWRGLSFANDLHESNMHSPMKNKVSSIKFLIWVTCFISLEKQVPNS